MIWLVAAAALPFVTQIEGRSPMLSGLPGVAVLVEDTTPEVRAAGLTEEQIRDRAASSLARAGVPLLQVSDALATARQPLLVIRLQAVRVPTSGAFAWSLAVGVHQRTASLGGPPDTSLSRTWAATETIGVTSARWLRRSVLKSLDEKIEELIPAWQAARR